MTEIQNKDLYLSKSFYFLNGEVLFKNNTQEFVRKTVLEVLNSDLNDKDDETICNLLQAASNELDKDNRSDYPECGNLNKLLVSISSQGNMGKTKICSLGTKELYAWAQKYCGHKFYENSINSNKAYANPASSIKRIYAEWQVLVIQMFFDRLSFNMSNRPVKIKFEVNLSNPITLDIPMCITDSDELLVESLLSYIKNNGLIKVIK